MTNEEKIKSLSTDDLATFLMRMDMSSVIPKSWACNEFSCYTCQNELMCYKEWLKKEESNECDNHGKR